MQEILGVSPVMGFGNLRVAFARFVPAASPAFQALNTATTDGMGIKTVERLAAGRWRATLAERSAGFAPHVDVVDPDTTNLHDVRIESVDTVNGQFTFVHRTAAFASPGSLALSDTVGGILITVIQRMGV